MERTDRYERSNRGSSPRGRTIRPWSKGSGHCPPKAEIRVRFPMAGPSLGRVFQRPGCSTVYAATGVQFSSRPPWGYLMSIQSGRKWKQEHQVENREYQRRLAEDAKQSALGRYGKCCARCGFSDGRALAIDHIANNGAQERHLLGGRNFSGYPFYRWLKKSGWPDGYQTLCSNCNLIKYSEFRYGDVVQRSRTSDLQSENGSSTPPIPTKVRVGNSTGRVPVS